MGNHCTIWFNATLRGDEGEIKVGDYTNIQDHATIHPAYSFKKLPCTIGNNVIIAHWVMLHGVQIADN